MNTQEYKFTFETNEDLRNAERTGYIDAYDCVRITKQEESCAVNFPCKSREEFYWCLDAYGNNITEIEQTVHSYDIQDYL